LEKNDGQYTTNVIMNNYNFGNRNSIMKENPFVIQSLASDKDETLRFIINTNISKYSNLKNHITRNELPLENALNEALYCKSNIEDMNTRKKIKISILGYLLFILFLTEDISHNVHLLKILLYAPKSTSITVTYDEFINMLNSKEEKINEAEGYNFNYEKFKDIITKNTRFDHIKGHIANEYLPLPKATHDFIDFEPLDKNGNCNFIGCGDMSVISRKTFINYIVNNEDCIVNFLNCFKSQAYKHKMDSDKQYKQNQKIEIYIESKESENFKRIPYCEYILQTYRERRDGFGNWNAGSIIIESNHNSCYLRINILSEIYVGETFIELRIELAELLSNILNDENIVVKVANKFSKYIERDISFGEYIYSIENDLYETIMMNVNKQTTQKGSSKQTRFGTVLFSFACLIFMSMIPRP
jgi:hypothetical protein